MPDEVPENQSQQISEMRPERSADSSFQKSTDIDHHDQVEEFQFPSRGIGWSEPRRTPESKGKKRRTDQNDPDIGDPLRYHSHASHPSGDKSLQNKQFKDSNNEKENQKDPKNDQNTQKKNDSKPEEKLEKSSTVQEKQTPAVFIDYKSHPKFNEELQNFENTLQEREVIQNFQTYNVSYDLASFIECYIGHCLTGSNGVKPDPVIIEDLFDSFEMIDGFNSASGILETLKLDKLKPPVMKFAINNAIENLSRLKYLMKGDLRALFVELICMLLNTSASDKNFIQTAAKELSFGIISE